MKNKILTFTLERQSKDQEWGLSLVGGWMEGQWIQVSQVSKKSYLLYIFISRVKSGNVGKLSEYVQSCKFGAVCM